MIANKCSFILFYTNRSLSDHMIVSTPSIDSRVCLNFAISPAGVSTFDKTIQEAALRTVSCISAVGSRFPYEVALSPNRAAAPYSLVRG